MKITNSSGNVGYGAIFFFIVLAFIVLFFIPQKYSKVVIDTPDCAIGQAADLKNPEILKDLPEVPDTYGEYNEIGDSVADGPPDPNRKTDFVLIRKNVPMPKMSEIQKMPFFGPKPPAVGNHTADMGEIPQKPGYEMHYPTWGGTSMINFHQEGMIFFVNKDPKMVIGTGDDEIYFADIYQMKRKADAPKRYTYDELFSCEHAKKTSNSAGLYIPTQSNSPDREQLQLQYFLLQRQGFATWSTHCKPAIYLYPPKRELVNVKVFPAAGGRLKYTDPLYDEKIGWNVEANPDGRIINLGANNFMKQYDYLYFESRVPDQVIQKPTKGWVIKPSDLETKFNDLLPKLGLNAVQTKDFIEYWQKALPYSPYYFIGIIDPKNVDQIEKLEITPKPDSINRVRIYFERLDERKSVEEPDLTKFGSWSLDLGSSAFRAVEWGGMVKNDPNHPFTCSQ